MKHRFTKRVDKLRNDALDALSMTSPLCVGAKGYDTFGFFIKDDNCNYEQLIWLNGEWMFVDRDGYLFPVYALNIEEFCSIIDGIVDDPNYKPN